MAKLTVEAEGIRYTIRYPRRDTVIKLLEQNADTIERIPDKKPKAPKPKAPKPKKSE